jgi:peptidase M23-like protein
VASSYFLQPTEGGLVFPLPAEACQGILANVADHYTRPLGNWQSDDAVDLAALPGTLVLAVEGGTVLKVDRRHEGVRSGFVYGAQLTLAGASGTRWFYTHVALIRPIAPGNRLHQGESIAMVAAWDDYPDAAHLHVGAGDREGRRGLPQRATELTRLGGAPYRYAAPDERASP